MRKAWAVRLLSLTAFVLFLVNSAAFGQSLEQTVAFITDGGEVDLAGMKVNADGSVLVPEHSLSSELSVQGLPLVIIPAKRIQTIDRENCVIYTISAANNYPGYVPQPEKHVYLKLNKITGFNETVASMRNPLNGSILTRTRIFAASEEPFLCISGGGFDAQLRPLPERLTCTKPTEPFVAVRQENLERVRKAIGYLYSHYCTLAKKKNAF